MPFLTNVLMGMHPAPNRQNHRGNEEEEVAPPDGTGPNAASVNPDDSSDATHVPDIVGYKPNPNRHDAATMRFRRILLLNTSFYSLQPWLLGPGSLARLNFIPNHCVVDIDSLHQPIQLPPYQHPSQSHKRRPRDQNAFGDGSDSEDDQPRHGAPEEDAPPEFNVYKDLNNTGVKYTTLLHGAADEPKLGREEYEEGHSNQFSKTQSPILDSEKSPQNRGADYSTIAEPLSAAPSQSRFQVDQSALASPSKPQGKLSQLKNSKNRWRIGSIVAFVAIAWSAPSGHIHVPPKHSKQLELTLYCARPLPPRPAVLPAHPDPGLGATPDSVRLATGQLDHEFTESTKMKKLTPLTLDVYFKYEAKLPSDTLWQACRKACGNIAESTVNGTIARPSVQLFLLIEFNVLGMFSTRYDSTQLTNVGCPAKRPPGAPSNLSSLIPHLLSVLPFLHRPFLSHVYLFLLVR
ncbi:hypothetical protein PtB15_17B195 [Puccinia triticina]|nr:hypothetical protein PtB15_17B195 [Puccinia triticina]